MSTSSNLKLLARLFVSQFRTSKQLHPVEHAVNFPTAVITATPYVERCWELSCSAHDQASTGSTWFHMVPHGSTFIQDTRGEVEDRSLILGTSRLPANPSSCRWHDQRSRCSQHAPRVQPPGNGAHEGTQIRHDIDLYYCMGNHFYSTTLNIGYWWILMNVGKLSMPAVPCLKSNSQTTNHIRGIPRLKIDDIDVLHRPWRQCWCNFETLVGTNIQTAHLAGHRVVRIQWSDTSDTSDTVAINRWWNDGILMESWYHVISQHNGGSQRELLLASPLSQFYLRVLRVLPLGPFALTPTLLKSTFLFHRLLWMHSKQLPCQCDMVTVTGKWGSDTVSNLQFQQNTSSWKVPSAFHSFHAKISTSHTGRSKCNPCWSMHCALVDQGSVSSN